ncbi:hypothetical protein Unana1_04986 [Umbelopsis nana]
MANSASGTETLQWCHSIGTINSITENPTSRAFALCANPTCNGCFDLEQFAPTVHTPPTFDTVIQELQATVNILQTKYQSLEDLEAKYQSVEDIVRKLLQLSEEKFASLTSENAALKEEIKNVDKTPTTNWEQ